MMLKDSLLLQPIDYDPNKAPTVILHHQGESNAGAGVLLVSLPSCHGDSTLSILSEHSIVWVRHQRTGKQYRGW